MLHGYCCAWYGLDKSRLVLWGPPDTAGAANGQPAASAPASSGGDLMGGMPRLPFLTVVTSLYVLCFL